MAEIEKDLKKERKERQRQRERNEAHSGYWWCHGGAAMEKIEEEKRKRDWRKIK